MLYRKTDTPAGGFAFQPASTHEFVQHAIDSGKWFVGGDGALVPVNEHTADIARGVDAEARHQAELGRVRQALRGGR